MKNKIALTAFILILMCGCDSSKIIHVWKANLPIQPKYNKIMVVGMMPENERNLREKMENHIAGDLTERGYTAISSLNEYGPLYFKNKTDEDVVAQLQNSGVDAVITIVLLDKEKEKYYVPARIQYSPYSVHRRRFYKYYNTINERIYTPGYYREDTKYFWESNFYEVNTKELLFSVQTKSFNPESTEDLAHEYGKLIVNNMVKNAILK